MRRALLSVIVAGFLAAAAPGSAARQEYRALWVDTFNTTLNSHGDVMRIVTSAKAAKLNALFVQVRRRGDAWYLETNEPPPDFTPIERAFDPLTDIVETAHQFGLEVHAWVIVGAVWNKDPALPPPANGLPLAPRHVFNRHGGYDPGRRAIVPDADTWLTRTLLPDGAGIAYQGHRINNEFWLDFGHPGAAAYIVDVLTELVRGYDIDGLHLDRIRYPELAAAGQSPTTGASIGYNTVSVARFQRRYGITAGSAPPSPADVNWSAWRRAQVTSLVRRIYLNCVALKPSLVMSAALIAFGGGPASDAAWNSAEAYWRVYQDWRAWTEEGILDLVIPMNYKRDHDATQSRQFDEWTAWLRSHQYRRAGLVGLAAYLNRPLGTVRQIRQSLASDRTPALGVSLFSLANATDTSNFADLASALTSGADAVFQDEAPVPPLAWKRAALDGHILGRATLDNGELLDGVSIELRDLRTSVTRQAETDGGGVFGFVDVPPGSYALRFAKSGTALQSTTVAVASGQVTSLSLIARAARQ